jgi:hypothetical protein
LSNNNIPCVLTGTRPCERLLPDHLAGSVGIQGQRDFQNRHYGPAVLQRDAQCYDPCYTQQPRCPRPYIQGPTNVRLFRSKTPVSLFHGHYAKSCMSAIQAMATHVKQCPEYNSGVHPVFALRMFTSQNMSAEGRGAEAMVGKLDMGYVRWLTYRDKWAERKEDRCYKQQ